MADRLSPARLSVFSLLAVGAASLDLWTKRSMFDWLGLPGVSGPYWLIDGVFGFQTSVNTGAIFGLGAGRGTLLAVFSVLALLFVLYWLVKHAAAESWWLTVALGLVTAGILGNLYDRLGLWWREGYPQDWRSGVRDWILFRIEGMPWFDPWPNFNVADSCLVVGACLLVILSFRSAPSQDPSPQTEATPQT